jgi:hypothetical protein
MQDRLLTQDSRREGDCESNLCFCTVVWRAEGDLDIFLLDHLVATIDRTLAEKSHWSSLTVHLRSGIGGDFRG